MSPSEECEDALAEFMPIEVECRNVKVLMIRVIESAIHDFLDLYGDAELKRTALMFLLDKQKCAWGCLASDLAERVGIGGEYWDKLVRDVFRYEHKLQRQRREIANGKQCGPISAADRRRRARAFLVNRGSVS